MATFKKGDRVKILDGAFATMFGVVKEVIEPETNGENTKIEAVVMIFDKPIVIHFDTWHLEKA